MVKRLLLRRGPLRKAIEKAASRSRGDGGNTTTNRDRVAHLNMGVRASGVSVHVESRPSSGSIEAWLREVAKLPEVQNALTYEQAVGVSAKSKTP